VPQAGDLAQNSAAVKGVIRPGPARYRRGEFGDNAAKTPQKRRVRRYGWLAKAAFAKVQGRSKQVKAGQSGSRQDWDAATRMVAPSERVG
jgi:hypothetical protein